MLVKSHGMLLPFGMGTETNKQLFASKSHFGLFGLQLDTIFHPPSDNKQLFGQTTPSQVHPPWNSIALIEIVSAFDISPIFRSLTSSAFKCNQKRRTINTQTAHINSIQFYLWITCGCVHLGTRFVADASTLGCTSQRPRKKTTKTPEILFSGWKDAERVHLISNSIFMAQRKITLNFFTTSSRALAIYHSLLVAECGLRVDASVAFLRSFIPSFRD